MQVYVFAIVFFSSKYIFDVGRLDRDLSITTNNLFLLVFPPNPHSSALCRRSRRGFRRGSCLPCRVRLVGCGVAVHSLCLRIVSRRVGKEVFYKAADTDQSRLLHIMIEKVMAISCPET